MKLSHFNIDYLEIRNEKEFRSLGLVQYNSGDGVCTFLDDIKYADNIPNNVTMIITNSTIADQLYEKGYYNGICVTDKPRIRYFELHNYLVESGLYSQNKYTTRIGVNCSISPLASIAKHNVTIGNNVVIEEFCSVKENTYIGDNSIIRAGCIVGSEGFEFKKKDIEVFGVKHAGSVVIGENVEIQYNSCIDKAVYPWDKTIIADNVKIDNLVHIAHGVKVGKRTMIAAQGVIGGRVSIGEDAWIGIGAVIRNGILIGEKSRVNMGSVVTKNVKSGESVSGNFAVEHKTFIEYIKSIAK